MKLRGHFLKQKRHFVAAIANSWRHMFLVPPPCSFVSEVAERSLSSTYRNKFSNWSQYELRGQWEVDIQIFYKEESVITKILFIYSI